MSLQQALEQRAKSLKHKDNQRLLQMVDNLPQLSGVCVKYNDTIVFDTSNAHTPNNLSSEQLKTLFLQVAKELIPWKKGPFRLFSVDIISEWDSSIKFNLLKPYFNVSNKRVCDIGANNGYYSLRLLPLNPKEVIIMDPVVRCMLQFNFLNKLYQFPSTCYELLGLEELAIFTQEKGRFDTILALGILYHRKDPLSTLKDLFNALNDGGELLLDTLILEGNEEIALTPSQRYAKMPNVFFIPTINALIGWLKRVGFSDIQHLATLKTTPQEQRVSVWGSAESLEDFLDSTQQKTIEGYQAPIRAYFKAIKT